MEEFELEVNGLNVGFVLISDKKEYRKLIRRLRMEQKFGGQIINVIRTKDEDDIEFYGDTAKRIEQETGISIFDYNYVIERFDKKRF